MKYRFDVVLGSDQAGGCCPQFHRDRQGSGVGVGPYDLFSAGQLLDAVLEGLLVFSEVVTGSRYCTVV